MLLDSCIGKSVRKTLATAGYDVIWSGDWDEDPGDEEILAQAFEESRILVTLDKDFGELAIVKGSPHKGILRLVDLNSEQQSQVGLTVLSLYGDELSTGAIITANSTRVRIRPPD